MTIKYLQNLFIKKMYSFIKVYNFHILNKKLKKKFIKFQFINIFIYNDLFNGLWIFYYKTFPKQIF